MAIDSYKTCVTVPNFFNLNTNFKLNTPDYRFWKLIYKSLEWPYNTNCDYYNRNNLYHSHENCIVCHIKYCGLFRYFIKKKLSKWKFFRKFRLKSLKIVKLSN
jgi:hypothetical protein